MNPTLNPLPTRTWVARPPFSGLWLVLGAAVLAGPARGDEPPRAPLPGPVLKLADNGVLPGTLVNSGRTGAVCWKSDSFETPFDFPLDGIQSIRFPSAGRTPAASGTFGFELSGGDLVFGSIVAMDDKVVTVDVPRLRRLQVNRTRIRRMFRWQNGTGVIYNGPNGLAGWREVESPRIKIRGEQVAVADPVGFVGENLKKTLSGSGGRGWVDDGGPLETTQDRKTIQGDLGLPSRAQIELEISWKGEPNFQISLGTSDDEKTVERAFRLEVWDGQLVALRETDKEANVAPIQSVGSGPGRAHLQLLLDQEVGKLLVFSETGEAVADLQLGGGSSPSLTGIRLANLRGDLRLERLRVRRWDGDPHPRQFNESCLQLTDQSIVRGQVDRFEATSREFIVRGEAGLSRIAEDQVETILLPGDEDDFQRTVQVAYHDGTRLAGRWIGVDQGQLWLTAPGIADPIRLPQEGLRSLDVVGDHAKTRNQDEPVSTLEMDGVRVLGRLVPTGRVGDGALTWQPLASETASAIRPGASGRIVFQSSAPKPQSRPSTNLPRRQAVAIPGQRVNERATPTPTTTLRRALYLRSGDVIPVEVFKIDEEGVWFQSSLLEKGFVAHSRIKAVELAASESPTVRVDKVKLERLLTLPRMQKDSPPTHLIRSKNGDILRGRVVGMDDKALRVEVRLEEKSVPRDRVSRIIWLHADEADPSKKLAGPLEGSEPPRVQAVRSDGTRLTFAAEKVVDGTLLGTSDVLGACKVKLLDLDQLLIGGFIEQEVTRLAYQNYKLQNAVEPKSAQVDGEGSPNGGVAGTEAALVGKEAPNFLLSTLGGEKFQLSESKGKIVVLDFWATWCGPCLQAMPQIERVTREFADKGVLWVAVNLQEAPGQIKATLERQKLSPKVALDRDGGVAQMYGATAIPQTVVIDREGKITRLFVGGGPRFGDQLREALQALLPPGQPEAQPTQP